MNAIKLPNMRSPLISLKHYLDKKKPFLIPIYQRGYVWGKSRNTEKDSVTFLMESIRNCYQNKTTLFLQGVTVSEKEIEIELIDGQQRTTTFYLLLHYLGYNGDFSINYFIRKKSHEFLESIKNKTTEEILNLCSKNDSEEYQDIYYFKKSIRLIDEALKDINKSDLLMFLLDNENVKFLYIDIPTEKATTVFKMMNGNKAIMKTEEIIKAEMLRLVSDRGIDPNSSTENKEALRWDENLIRSKYAREWDKWLYWWNKEEVKAYYHTTNVMGLLVETYFSNTNKAYNFENFRDIFLRGSDNTFKAKDTFYKLRQLQKKFEDVFNSFDETEVDNRLHNKVGAILTLFKIDDRKKFISTYFAKQKRYDIDNYLKLVYLGLGFSEIERVLTKKEEKEETLIQEKKDILHNTIENDNLYNLTAEEKEQAFIQLLRRNIEEDTKLKRKFDFSIWKERSLEHIYPKSKVFHMDNGVMKNGAGLVISQTDASFLNREDFAGMGSEHCIGNLVLLYKNENSSFGAKDFNDKKAVYFNLTPNTTFRSRHLLHTISVFAQNEWGAKEIQENKQRFVKEIKNYYGI